MSKSILSRLASNANAAPTDSHQQAIEAMQRDLEQAREKALSEGRAQANAELVKAKMDIQKELTEAKDRQFKAEAEMLTIKGQLARAEAMVEKAEAEAARSALEVSNIRQSMEGKMEMGKATEHLTASLKQKIEELEGQLEGSLLSETLAKYELEQERTKDLMNETQTEKERAHNLEVELSALRGRVEEQERFEMERAEAIHYAPPEPVKPPPPPPSPVIMPQPKIPEFAIGNIMRGHDNRIVSATISPVMTDD